MKKLFNLLMVALMAVCFAVPAMGKAEAAKVVVLPLVNNSGSETAGQIYISGAIQLFDYPEYELLENDATNDAIAAENIGKDGASKDAMVRIAKASGADLVVGMVLDTCEDNPVFPSAERILKLDITGKTYAYSAVNSKFYEHRIYEDKEIDETLTSRWDWVSEEFGRCVTREMKRVDKAFMENDF